jgi:hypothetical protein
MNRLRTDKPKKSPFFKRAVAGLALATLAMGYLAYRFKPAPDHQKHGQDAEETERVQEKAEARKPAAMPPLLAPVPGKAAAAPPANDALARIIEEFPSESLDCRLEPWRSKERPWNYEKLEDAAELIWDELKDMPGTATKGLGKDYDPEKASELFCRVGLFPMPKDCPSELTEKIEQLRKSNDADGLLAIMSHLNGLSIEWGRSIYENSASSISLDGRENPENLFSAYLGVYQKASFEGSETAPRLSCVARNAYALRIMRMSQQALESVIAKNGTLAESVLGRLPEYQQRRALGDIGGSLIFGNDFDTVSAADFLSALSPGSRARLAEELAGSYSWAEEGRVARLGKISESVPDPQFKDSMGRLAQSWKASGAHNAAVEVTEQGQPEDSENQGTENENQE